MSQASSLYQLQKVDSRIDQIQSRVKIILTEMASEAIITEAEKEVTRIAKELSDISDNSVSLEDKINVKKIKAQQSESVLYGGKIVNPKELQDLQNEIASLKKAISDLEDQLMAILEMQENTNQYYAKAIQALEEARNKDKSNKKILQEELDNLTAQLISLQQERQMAILQVDETSLDLYNDLRLKKKGIAVALVEDRSCSICGAGMTPAEWQAARSPGRLVRCSACARILYSE